MNVRAAAQPAACSMQVKCTECGHESNTHDVFLDLSLEINKASSVGKALQRFTTSEYLDGPNKYICPKQKKKVRAAKCMTIDQAPAVLVVQLKRFEFSMFGHKINKKVDFETELDLAPFMSNRRGASQPYSLYGVLVHSGHSVHSGHYFAFVKAPNGLWHQLDDNHVSQVSERMVLSQKAYILFYIRKPTNGHAVPAELAQHAQQLSKGLNSLHAAPVQGQGPADRPPASNSKHPVAPAVFGPAQRPAQGLLAAKQRHAELLAPAAKAPHTSQVNARHSGAAPAADPSTCATSQPAPSFEQLPALCGKGISDLGASHQQTGAQEQASAEGQEQVKRAAKRKADLLRTGKRPSMMQKMSAAGIDAAVVADPITEQAPKRKKPRADPPSAAAAPAAAAAAAADGDDKMPAVRQSPQSAALSVNLASGSKSSTRQSDYAEHTAPAVQTEGQEKHVAQGVDGSSRHASGAPLQGLEGAASPPCVASPSSAHDSPVRHGTATTIRSPVRRPARNVLFPSPQNDWQGRSWNRLNLHNHIHRAHYARHIVANALSQHSLSPPHSSPEQLHGSGSPPRARYLPAERGNQGSPGGIADGVLETGARLASDTAASSAERPLQELTHPHLLNSAAAEPRHTGAEAAVGEPPAKRQLLVNGMRRGDPSTHPWLANGHPHIELSRSAGVSHLASQSKAVSNNPGNGATPPEEIAAPAAGDTALAPGAAADSMHLSGSAETGRLGAEDQQQEATLQMNGTATLRAGPASVKAFLNGIHHDAAPWDDLDPALAKSRATLHRQQAPRAKPSRDEYNTEYDMGKQKKVKSKRGGPDAWQQGTNIFCQTAARGRGRGQGRFGGSAGRGGRGHHSRSGGRGGGHDRSVHRGRGRH
ncbi:hypothetical protein ABBQ32_013412 [Trebouxia sp. C0010 RCD-2024]